MENVDADKKDTFSLEKTKKNFVSTQHVENTVKFTKSTRTAELVMVPNMTSTCISSCFPHTKINKGKIKIKYHLQ